MTRHEKFQRETPVEVTVRVGTPADIDGCMALAIAAAQENSYLSANPNKLLADLWAALNLDRGIVGLIGAPGQQLEGIVLLRIGEVWYSDDMGVEERAIFIHPDFRSAKGGRAARLCEFSMKVSDELGLPLMIGVLSSERTEAKIRMYTRLMGPPSGAYWLYNAKTGGHPTLDNVEA